MPIFLLIRHGENEYVKKGRMAGRLPGIHLNERGRQQAQALAERLVQAQIKAIYSSPLERAMETAEPLARALGLDIIPRPGLIETDIGEWAGERTKGLSRLKIWKTVQRQPSIFRFPGGETFADGQHRIAQDLGDLATRHEPKDLVACFSHADPIKMAVAFYIGLPLDLFQRLAVSPGSITALMISPESSFLLNLNYDLSFNLPGG